MITDDELLLYHYRDGLDAAERARIGTALSEQPELAQRLQALVSRLDAFAALPEVPVPELTQRRWQVALQRAARQDDQRDVRVPRAAPRWDFRWAAAAAVAVVALILIIPNKPAEVTTPVATITEGDKVDASAYERGLKVHLASTERQLAGLDSFRDHRQSGEPGIGDEQRTRDAQRLACIGQLRDAARAEADQRRIVPVAA